MTSADPPSSAVDLKPESAVQKALALLAKRSRTAVELDRALERNGYSEEERKTAVARMRELGYMDDRETAKARARTLIEQGKGPRLAARRLQAQGVSETDASAAVAEARGEAGDDELARRALDKKLRGRAPADLREKQRLLRSLVSKGHRPAAAAKALGLEWDGDED